MHDFCLMRFMKWFTLLPLLLAGGIIFNGCSEVKEPEFRRLEKLGLRKLSLQDATIGFNVTYFNPNNFGVTDKEAEADIYIDSTYLGKFTQDSAIGVGKDAEFSIPFSGKVSLETALGLNLENITTKEVLLKADGSAKIGKAGIYITKPIQYQGRHRLDEIKLK